MDKNKKITENLRNGIHLIHSLNGVHNVISKKIHSIDTIFTQKYVWEIYFTNILGCIKCINSTMNSIGNVVMKNH